MGSSVLHWAAEDGKDLSGAVLDESSLNLPDVVGRTPLHLAVLSGSLDTAQQLLSAQANTKLSDELGQTALHYASERVG